MLPLIIFLMILFPVLIPAAITAVHAMQRAYRPATTAGLAPRSPRSRRRLTSVIPAGATPTVWPRLVLWGIRLQNRGAVPVTGEQREFYVEPIAADLADHAGRRRDPPDTSPS